MTSGTTMRVPPITSSDGQGYNPHMNSQDKGRALEDAAHAIEAAILRACPGYSQNTFLIERRKLVLVDGVRHEVDVWVRVDIADGYHAVFVFECKNVASPVDKNEVIVFSEKVKACGAQTGFFVAPQYTQFARAQANLDGRLVLLQVTESDPLLSSIPAQLHSVADESTQVSSLHLYSRGSEPTARSEPLNTSSAKARWRERDVPLMKALAEILAPEKQRMANSFPSSDLPTGSYVTTSNVKRSFRHGELAIDGVDIEQLEAEFSVTFRVVQPIVRSVFEVEGRGRAIVLEPMEVRNGISLQVTFAEVK
jgi:hypothetical protein